MEEKQSKVVIFEQDTTITLYDENDKPIEFYEIASIEHDEKFYELLQPVNPSEEIGLDEGEAVILEYVLDEDNKDKTFKPIFDEELLEKLFSLYLNEVSDEDEGCAGGCGGCSGCSHHE